MAPLIIIVLFVLLFIYLFTRKEKVEKPKQYQSIKNLKTSDELNLHKIESKPSQSIVTSTRLSYTTAPAIEKQPKKIIEEPIIPGLDNDVFRDKFDDYANEDYSYLSPAEARAEFKRRKANGEYLTNEEYFGYMEAIDAEKYDKWINEIDDMEPKQALAWFKRKLNSNTKMSTAVWRAVGLKVAPYQEEELLTMLEKVTGGRVEGWVNARKREGYFFTQFVYDEAKAKRIAYLKGDK